MRKQRERAVGAQKREGPRADREGFLEPAELGAGLGRWGCG